MGAHNRIISDEDSSGRHCIGSHIAMILDQNRGFLVGKFAAGKHPSDVIVIINLHSRRNRTVLADAQSARAVKKGVGSYVSVLAN